MTELVIAVDPGGTTGLAFWTPEDGVNAHPIEPRQRTNWRQLCEDLHGWIYHYRQHTTIVCESYTITAETAKKSRQYDALYIIGVIHYLVHLAGPESAELVMQRPSDAKQFGTDARLKKLGWWRPGEGHAMDAHRHLFLYLAKSRLLDVSEVDDASR